MRRLWPVLPVLLAVAVALLGPVRSAGRDEEEEVSPKKPTKKVVVEDDTPGGAAGIPELARAATSAKQPALKKYFATMSVACDRISLASGKVVRVVLLPYLWDKDGAKFRANPDGFGAAVLDDDNRPGDPQAVLPKDVRAIDPFERFAVRETDKLVSSTASDAPPLYDRLAAAERVLTAVLFYHDAAVEASPPRRRGPNWEPVKAEVVDKLLDVRTLLVREAAQNKDWRRVNEAVAKYAELYKNKPKVLEELHAARLGEAAELVKSPVQADLERARDILAAFDAVAPNSDNETAKAVRTALAERAKQKLNDVGSTADKKRAQDLLNEAKQLTPDDPAVLAKQKELRAGYSGLVVGVPRMPRLMSPATAREDSERMAVELLFEGLLDPLPDEQYGRVFRPLLAAQKPLVSPLARDLTLLGNAAWGKAGGGTFDAADLVGTIQLMRAKRTLPSAEAADWLADPTPDPDDPNRVTLKFAHAHPDPRQLLTFKVLPGKYLAGKKKGIDDQIGGDSFARTPFGTGPYTLAPGFVPADEDKPVKEIAFVPNAGYRRRPGRIGEPELSEIRFVPTAGRATDDLVRDVSAEQIHILTDVPTADLDKFRGLPRATVVTAASNRRIYMLAVNHTTDALKSADVRRGVSLAIDREAILNEIYRAGTKHHQALAGPFPAGSWLTPGTVKPLYDRDLAAGKLRDATGHVKLLYPTDDVRAEQACKRIAAQVTAAGGLEVEPEGVSPVDLRTRVDQGRYELAYLPFDYPDMWHSHALAALLDPSAATDGGRNFLKYMAKGTRPTRADDGLAEALAELKTHRDSDVEVKKASKEVWDRFLEATPFVPLWQLDRHMVVSTSLKVYFDGRVKEVPYEQLDPITLFANVSRWKLEDSK